MRPENNLCLGEGSTMIGGAFGTFCDSLRGNEVP
jgi:hypothetical protein